HHRRSSESHRHEDPAMLASVVDVCYQEINTCTRPSQSSDSSSRCADDTIPTSTRRPRTGRPPSAYPSTECLRRTSYTSRPNSAPLYIVRLTSPSGTKAVQPYDRLRTFASAG